MSLNISNLSGGIVELTNGWTDASLIAEYHWSIVQINDTFKNSIKGFSFLLVILKDGKSDAKAYDRKRYCLIYVEDFLSILDSLPDISALPSSTITVRPIGVTSASEYDATADAIQLYAWKNHGIWLDAHFQNASPGTAYKYKIYGIK